MASESQAALKWYERFDLWLSRHWLALFNTFISVIVVTPYLAPLFMRLGLADIADRIYFLYTILGHQLPQRSIFLFGPRLMYSLPEITAMTQSLDPLGNRYLSQGHAPERHPIGTTRRLTKRSPPR